ncbi:Hint domain-containing protein [Streptomyces sp. A012304]|uniref:Hint domain-containing protein n=1 Tax=Streptomyces sp. A012304 TaxID=375446 RepID=UPI0022302092|nr:Hint domain-containing protein [Streptomyces sp. A012304]
MAAKAAKYAGDITKAADKTGDVADKIETAVECTSTAMDVASMAAANSFMPGTEVVIADGSRKPIEQVKEGDEVLAADRTTGKTQTEGHRHHRRRGAGGVPGLHVCRAPPRRRLSRRRATCHPRHRRRLAVPQAQARRPARHQADRPQAADHLRDLQ